MSLLFFFDLLMLVALTCVIFRSYSLTFLSLIFRVNHLTKIKNVGPLLQNFVDPCMHIMLTCRLYRITEPVHEFSNNVVCAINKASDQPAHTRSLIRAFAGRLRIICLLSY